MKTVLLPLTLLTISCGAAQNPSNSNATIQAVVSNTSADSCEFFVDGFAETFQYNQGWSRKSMHAEIMIRDLNIQKVGMWVRYRDIETDKTQNVEVEAIQGLTPLTRGNFRWVAEFAISGTDNPFSISQPISRFDYEIIAFAFFAERPTGTGYDTERIWMSNGGRNFNLGETMSEPTYPGSLGRGSIIWSNQNSPLFYQKKACN
jgi:hypothetical protein